MRPTNSANLRYQPGDVPDDPKDLPRYLRDEFVRLRDAINADLQLDSTNVAPTKPRSGMVRYADGTNWNPGGGQGIYAYYGGAWVKL